MGRSAVLGGRPREGDEHMCGGLSPSEHGFGLAKHTIPDTGFGTLFRDDIDPASEPILQEIFHRNEIDQTELDVRGDIDEYVDVTVGTNCAADDRSEESELCESTLAQLLLERSEFDDDFVLPWRFAVRHPGRRPFALDVQPKCGEPSGVVWPGSLFCILRTKTLRIR